MKSNPYRKYKLIFMEFWNYCPNCGKRLMPNEEFCLSCGIKTIFKENEDIYIFTPPIHNIGFFDLGIDFSPYIIRDADFKYDICSCGYLNNIHNEFCPHCGVKRIGKGLSKFIKRFERPVFNIDDFEGNVGIICECGAVNLPDSEFCEMCGYKLHKELKSDDTYANFELEYENPIFCSCGEENSEDSQFCENCGLPLDSYKNIDNIKILCVCSVLNESTSDFCVECGNNLNEEIVNIICVCGTTNSVNSRFCSSCKKPLNPDRLIKSKLVCDCGKIMEFNSEFCPNCGKNIKKVINRKKNFSKTIKSVKDILHGV